MSGHNLQSHVVWKNGDIEAGFQKAARIFEHTFRTPLSHHGYIEPCACTVHVHSDGRVEVWPSNKGPWGLRDQMAEDFGVPKEKIKVHIVHVGGDFGAKASLIDVPIAYYLSKATGAASETRFRLHRRAARRRPPTSSGTLASNRRRSGRNISPRSKRTIHFSGGAYGSQKANPASDGARRAAAGEHV